MIKISKFFSYLFHPIFAPFLSIYILLQLPTYLNYQLTAEIKTFIYSVIILNLIVCPILISFYLKRKGIIKSMKMETVSERIYPYLTTSLFYIVTFFLLNQIRFPLIYLNFLKAALFIIISLLIFAWVGRKISAHLAALGGISGMLYLLPQFFSVDTTILLIAFILVAGFVATARYSLKAHTYSELIMGFILGFGMQFVVLL